MVRVRTSTGVPMPMPMLVLVALFTMPAAAWVPRDVQIRGGKWINRATGLEEVAIVVFGALPFLVCALAPEQV